VVKALIEGHPEKELIKKYLNQYKDLYGDELYLNITKKDFLIVGLINFFPLITRR
tara:strand:- start:855 stop:1019 length:165 start_codon:yes stop_codon:yes gene_type:complete